MKNKKIVLIFDNCEKLLKKSFSGFMNNIMDIINSTNYLKVILITSKDPKITAKFKKSNKYNEVFLDIKELKYSQAVRFFHKIAFNNPNLERKYRDEAVLAEEKVFKEKLINFYPSQLISLNKQLTSEKNLS